MNGYDIWILYLYAFNALLRDKRRKKQYEKLCEMYFRKLKGANKK